MPNETDPTPTVSDRDLSPEELEKFLQDMYSSEAEAGTTAGNVEGENAFTFGDQPRTYDPSRFIYNMFTNALDEGELATAEAEYQAIVSEVPKEMKILLKAARSSGLQARNQKIRKETQRVEAEGIEIVRSRIKEALRTGRFDQAERLAKELPEGPIRQGELDYITETKAAYELEQSEDQEFRAKTRTLDEAIRNRDADAFDKGYTELFLDPNLTEKERKRLEGYRERMEKSGALDEARKLKGETSEKKSRDDAWDELRRAAERGDYEIAGRVFSKSQELFTKHGGYNEALQLVAQAKKAYEEEIKSRQEAEIARKESEAAKQKGWPEYLEYKQRAGLPLDPVEQQQLNAIREAKRVIASTPVPQELMPRIMEYMGREERAGTIGKSMGLPVAPGVHGVQELSRALSNKMMVDTGGIPHTSKDPTDLRGYAREIGVNPITALGNQRSLESLRTMSAQQLGLQPIPTLWGGREDPSMGFARPEPWGMGIRTSPSAMVPAGVRMGMTKLTPDPMRQPMSLRPPAAPEMPDIRLSPLPSNLPTPRIPGYDQYPVPGMPATDYASETGTVLPYWGRRWGT